MGVRSYHGVVASCDVCSTSIIEGTDDCPTQAQAIAVIRFDGGSFNRGFVRCRDCAAERAEQLAARQTEEQAKTEVQLD